MGGERASTTRQRISGEICCWCKTPFDNAPWQGGERACDRCKAQMTANKPRRVYLQFYKREEWTVQLMTEDLRGSLGRLRGFATHDKLLEMISRTPTRLDLAAKNSLENAIKNGRGGLFLDITAEQYEAWRNGK
jgi:hypothetical protein